MRTDSNTVFPLSLDTPPKTSKLSKSSGSNSKGEAFEKELSFAKQESNQPRATASNGAGIEGDSQNGESKLKDSSASVMTTDHSDSSSKNNSSTSDAPQTKQVSGTDDSDDARGKVLQPESGNTRQSESKVGSFTPIDTEEFSALPSKVVNITLSESELLELNQSFHNVNTSNAVTVNPALKGQISPNKLLNELGGELSDLQTVNSKEGSTLDVDTELVLGGLTKLAAEEVVADGEGEPLLKNSNLEKEVLFNPIQSIHNAEIEVNGSGDVPDMEQAITGPEPLEGVVSVSLPIGEQETESPSSLLVTDVKPKNALSDVDGSVKPGNESMGHESPDSAAALLALVKSGSLQKESSQEGDNSVPSGNVALPSEGEPIFGNNLLSDKTALSDKTVLSEEDLFTSKMVSSEEMLPARDQLINDSELTFLSEEGGSEELSWVLSQMSKSDAKVVPINSGINATSGLDKIALPASVLAAGVTNSVGDSSGETKDSLSELSEMSIDELLAGEEGFIGEESVVEEPVELRKKELEAVLGRMAAPVEGRAVEELSTGGLNSSLQGGSILRPMAAPSALANAQQANLTMSVPPEHPNWASEISQKVNWVAREGGHTAHIRLDPPELGSLTVKISVDNDSTTQVSFVAATPQARDLIESQMNRLREMLAQQGMDLSKADVDVAQQDASGMQRDNNEGSEAQGVIYDEAEDEQMLGNTSYVSATGVDYYA